MGLVKNCPCYRDYDVFGLPNEGCCYNYMDYCKNHDNCIMKEIMRKCKNFFNNTQSGRELANSILEIIKEG